MNDQINEGYKTWSEAYDAENDRVKTSKAYYKNEGYLPAALFNDEDYGCESETTKLIYKDRVVLKARAVSASARSQRADEAVNDTWVRMTRSEARKFKVKQRKYIKWCKKYKPRDIEKELAVAQRMKDFCTKGSRCCGT